jgi:hypothetical protein
MRERRLRVEIWGGGETIFRIFLSRHGQKNMFGTRQKNFDLTFDENERRLI